MTVDSYRTCVREPETVRNSRNEWFWVSGDRGVEKTGGSERRWVLFVNYVCRRSKMWEGTRKRLKNRREGLKMSWVVEKDTDGWGWLKIMENGRRWLGMVRNGSKEVQVVGNGKKRMKMVEDGQ
jgi:hypothetical protein